MYRAYNLWYYSGMATTFTIFMFSKITNPTKLLRFSNGYYPCIKISELNWWSFSPSSWSPSNWWHETLVSSLFGYKNPNVKKQTLLRCLLCLIILMRNLLLITLDGMQWKSRWNSSWSTTFVFTVVEDGALFFFPPFVVLPNLPELWCNFADEFMACLQICHVET